ncbi:hypothetical protein [Companilactobacillus musae]|uniref:hypothetical protein n=1 Tax=Companilactobacillus musae TaxID=1903258 RepID=UPI000E65DCD5|nr:hypothetical protein [Companilactobacillus musae]
MTYDEKEAIKQLKYAFANKGNIALSVENSDVFSSILQGDGKKLLAGATTLLITAVEKILGSDEDDKAIDTSDLQNKIVVDVMSFIESKVADEDKEEANDK